MTDWAASATGHFIRECAAPPVFSGPSEGVGGGETFFFAFYEGSLSRGSPSLSTVETYVWLVVSIPSLSGRSRLLDLSLTSPSFFLS